MHDQITIGGISTYDNLGLTLLDEPSLKPPEPKTYYTDIPGGDGQLDFTEFGGDIAYGMREQVFEFLFPNGDIENQKTNISKLFHGQKTEFSLSWDDGWAYTGRWSVDEYQNHKSYGTIKLKVIADPYKTSGMKTVRVNAAGGITVYLQNGRKKVCPTIEVQRKTLVSYGGNSWTLEKGSHKISDLWLSSGVNRISVNTYPDYAYGIWLNYKTHKWSEYSGKMLSKFAEGDKPLQSSDVWTNYAGKTWLSITGETWQELSHPASIGDEYSAYFQFEIKEL